MTRFDVLHGIGRFSIRVSGQVRKRGRDGEGRRRGYWDPTGSYDLSMELEWSGVPGDPCDCVNVLFSGCEDGGLPR